MVVIKTMNGLDDVALPVVAIMNLLQQCFPQAKSWNDFDFIPRYRHFFMCKDDDINSVSAYLSIDVNDPGVIMGKTVFVLYNVCVDPSHRGEGLMKTLIRHAIKELIIPRVNQPCFGLYVDKSNTEALNLYKHLGFERLQDNPNNPTQDLMVYHIKSVLLTFDFDPTTTTRRRRVLDLITPKMMTQCVANAFETARLITTQQQRTRIIKSHLNAEKVIGLMRKKKKKIIFRHDIGNIFFLKHFIQTNLPENKLMFLTLEQHPMNHITTIAHINSQFHMIDYQEKENVISGIDAIIDVLSKNISVGHTFYTYTLDPDRDVTMRSTPEIIASKNPLTQLKSKSKDTAQAQQVQI
jgi:ribosomal protein S18 acetylase RimI-like enzyme